MRSASLGVLVALVVFLTFAGHASAQPHPPGPPPEMKKLDFLVGRWEQARTLLHRLPKDGPSGFLSRYMARSPSGPPEGWKGIIEMDVK